MPHREPKKFVDGPVFVKMSEDDKVMVVLGSEHPQLPGNVVGQITRQDREHYTAYTLNGVKDRFGVDMGSSTSMGVALGSFTSIECAIARLEYRDGRLTTKRKREFACPDCDKEVMTVMLRSAIPKLVDTERVDVYASTRGDGIYSKTTGYKLHECNKEAKPTI